MQQNKNDWTRHPAAIFGGFILVSLALVLYAWYIGDWCSATFFGVFYCILLGY